MQDILLVALLWFDTWISYYKLFIIHAPMTFYSSVHYGILDDEVCQTNIQEEFCFNYFKCFDVF